MLTIEMSS